jgi:hypothetical protein
MYIFSTLATLPHFKSVVTINTPCSIAEDTIFTTSDVTLNSQLVCSRNVPTTEQMLLHRQQVLSWRSCALNAPVLFSYSLITLWAAIWNRPAVTTTKVWKLSMFDTFSSQYFTFPSSDKVSWIKIYMEKYNFNNSIALVWNFLFLSEWITWEWCCSAECWEVYVNPREREEDLWECNNWIMASYIYIDVDVEINQLNALNYILLYFSYTMAPTCFGKTMPCRNM